MLFAIICHDKKAHGHVRMENRPAHLDYLKGYADKAYAVGPLLSDDGEAMIGSLLILDLEDKVAAEAFAANDPYNQAGLFDSVTIAPWKKVLPAD
ncbi:MAG: YciI family protein [Rhodospirillales bacterium]|nr:YciI family protein [Rhodospirillales bacterium]